RREEGWRSSRTIRWRTGQSRNGCANWRARAGLPSSTARWFAQAPRRSHPIPARAARGCAASRGSGNEPARAAHQASIEARSGDPDDRDCDRGLRHADGAARDHARGLPPLRAQPGDRTAGGSESDPRASSRRTFLARTAAFARAELSSGSSRSRAGGDGAVNNAFKQRRARIGWLTLALASLFVVAVMRLVVLVAFDGPRLSSLARSEHTAEVQLAAVRGPIVDRNGEPLALSAETRSVFAHPRRVFESSSARDRAKLAVALGITPADLEKKLRKPSPFVWLARRIPADKAQAAESLGIDGVGAVSEYKRFYPESNLASAVVGLAGMDGQGLSGLELEYDRLVRGEPVALHFYHDALGHPILDSPLALKSPEPGAQLELTIDSSIQSLAETRLAAEVEQSGAHHGAAIVMDPFTGEILAMANVSADPSELHDRLHNAAVQDAFEPGSTMKGMLASIALADGAITPAKQFYCENGKWTIDRRTIHDDARHGWLDLGGIIEVSSNIGAAKIALTLGADRFYNGLRAFGIGYRTGIDLPGEAAGLIMKPSTWREIDLANHGFGQGVGVTPIQLAVAYSAIANGGLIVRPYLVKAAYDA